MPYVKFIGWDDPQNEITEISLGDKMVVMGVPVELSAGEQKKLEDRGFLFEKSSKEEADKAASDAEPTGQAVGGDITGAAPKFGSGDDQEK